MPKVDLVLVLSGHICRPQSVDMRPFWKGFIELQRKLPVSRNIRFSAVHSWNPEFADLVKLVYAPDAERHEKQNNFYPEFLHLINPPDYFETDLDRLNSTWKNVTIQTVLGNARSRARAIKLLVELEASQAQVLITRWDLGQTGSSQVNQLVADAALPVEYMYLAYFSEVDEGYADMWILAPMNLAKQFSELDDFVLSSLSGKNDYLNKFCESGWRRSRPKTRCENLIGHGRVRQIRNHLLEFTDYIDKRTKPVGRLNRLVCRIIYPRKHVSNPPALPVENSCVSVASSLHRTFPRFVALNIHALLKYFIIKKGFRPETRFLSQSDFQILEHSGQIINPQPLALIVWSDTSDDTGDDEHALNSLLEASPLPLSVVMQLGDKIRAWTKDDSGNWGCSILNPVAKSSREKLLSGLNFLDNELYGSLPVLILPKAKIYLKCSDWFYLNAILKYTRYHGLDYVGINGDALGKPSLDFPEIYFSRGEDIFSLKRGLGTLRGLYSFVRVAHSDLEVFSKRVNAMQLEFPVVSKSEPLFPVECENYVAS